MSRGREAYSLAGLQAASRRGLAVEVARRMLGDPEAPLVQVAAWIARNDLLDSANLDEDCWTLPADWAHRTTPEDVRREVADLMTERAPEWTEWVWPLLSHDLQGIPDALLSPMLALAERCRREVLQSLPKRPGKRKQIARMPLRREAPCSPVVTRSRSGFYYDQYGRPLTPGDAKRLLTTFLEDD